MAMGIGPSPGMMPMMGQQNKIGIPGNEQMRPGLVDGNNSLELRNKFPNMQSPMNPRVPNPNMSGGMPPPLYQGGIGPSPEVMQNLPKMPYQMQTMQNSAMQPTFNNGMNQQMPVGPPSMMSNGMANNQSGVGPSNMQQLLQKLAAFRSQSL